MRQNRWGKLDERASNKLYAIVCHTELLNTSNEFFRLRFPLQFQVWHSVSQIV